MNTLDGVRVLDLTRLLPGPYTTRLLAELGAEVIKIESKEGGDYARWWPPLFGDPPSGAIFRECNFGKKSVVLDLKSQDAQEAMRFLVAQADVLVEGFRPGVLDRLGLGSRALMKINPRLVYCGITGFGLDGPDAQRAGHDLGYMARAGALLLTGPKEAPQTVGVQVADIGGALFAFSGILAALYEREKTGLGKIVDVSLTESAMAFATVHFAKFHAGEMPVRGEEILDGSRPCYRVYRTGDDKFLAVAALEPKFWTTFVDAIGLPELKEDGLDAGSKGRQIEERVQSRLTEKTREQWMEIFDRIDCCVEPVLDLAEVRGDDQVKHRQVIAGDGYLRSPLRPWAALVDPPALGEHTEEVLRELGVPDALLKKLSPHRG